MYSQMFKGLICLLGICIKQKMSTLLESWNNKHFNEERYIINVELIVLHGTPSPRTVFMQCF